MSKTKFCKSDPAVLAVLNELDVLLEKLKEISSSLKPESKSSVDLNHIIERTERLRTQVACMTHKDVDWVGIIQAIVCIAQYLSKLWE